MADDKLYLNMPQGLGVINGWLNEALLRYYYENRTLSGDESLRTASTLDTLQRANLRRLTQLLALLVDGYGAGEIRWRTEPRITGDAAFDRTIAMSVRNIIDSRAHHRLLGFLSEN